MHQLGYLLAALTLLTTLFDQSLATVQPTLLTSLTSEDDLYSELCLDTECAITDLTTTTSPTKVCFHNDTCSCHCLPLAAADHNTACFVSSQCSTPGCHCLDTTGLILDHLDGSDLVDMDTSSWDERVAEGPGKCVCPPGLRYSNKVDICVPRVAGSKCKSHYTCTQKMALSRCVDKECQCSPDSVYHDGMDECRFVGLTGSDKNKVCITTDCCTDLRTATILVAIGSGLVMTSMWAFCAYCQRSKSQRRQKKRNRAMAKQVDFASLCHDVQLDRNEVGQDVRGGGEFGVGESADFTMDGGLYGASQWHESGKRF